VFEVSERSAVSIIVPLSDALAANKLVQHFFAMSLPKAFVPQHNCVSHSVFSLVFLFHTQSSEILLYLSVSSYRVQTGIEVGHAAAAPLYKMSVVDLLYRLAKCIDNTVVFKKIMQHALADADKANIFRHTVADPEIADANREMLKTMLTNDESLWQKSADQTSLQSPAV